MIPLTDDNSMLGYGLLSACPGIVHFVTTRQGGCSKGTYASFNCSPYCGDEEEAVRANRRLLEAGLPVRPAIWVIPRQVHGTEALLVDEAYLRAAPARREELLDGVDALLTRQPGCCLCVSTADCVPLLLYDRRNLAVAAVHAGWRGTCGRIVGRTLARMEHEFGTRGEDVLACIGPSISPEAFEVGEEVYEAFRQAGFEMPLIAARHPQSGKWHIDLWEANRLQLLAFGIPEAQIELAGICTYRHFDTFFSARRLGIRSGRMLSGIGLISS